MPEKVRKPESEQDVTAQKQLTDSQPSIGTVEIINGESKCQVKKRKYADQSHIDK